ncbi:protein of unknown function [Magnetospirillum sp. XM-1]|uniref:hypothetical protein n=1 Tax=Magnetospirillum sp. XM-1 TaxID=1663591 RepID=UPI00073DC5E2|nr:hypothetical protein [Magnetospirillum sp. XM-1]CUW41113.1 protein of unknown function [Magnetospirillum sp. XM-1]
MTIAATIPTGPALRLHLIELLLPTAGAGVIEMAAKAEEFVLYQRYCVPAEATDDLAADLAEERQWDAIIMPGDEPDPVTETDHDRPVETPVATSDSGSTETGERGGQPAESGDLLRDADAGNPAHGDNGESGDPSPAQGPGQESPAQDLTPPPAPSRKVPQGHVQWTTERKAELHRLCQQGLEAKEIEECMGLRNGSAFANAYRFGWIDEWRIARERRRDGQSAEEAQPQPERNIPAGQSWALTGHRTMAEVMAAETGTEEKGVELQSPQVEIRTGDDDVAAMALVVDRPAAPPPMPPSEEQRLIEEHIKAKGVTHAEPDYGPDQPAVDALRRSYNDVVRSNDPNSPWLINGQRCTTSLLWKRANADRKARREKPIKRKA